MYRPEPRKHRHATPPMAGGRAKCKYNLLAAAHKAMKQPSDHTHKGRAFTVHLTAHHHTFVRGRRYAPTTHANVAPPFMCREIMELIATLVDSRTVSDVLKAEQRVIALYSVHDFIPDGTDHYSLNVLRNAFPDPKRNEYMRTMGDYNKANAGWDDVICMRFECFDKSVTRESRLAWTMRVDLKQICITRGTKSLVLPAKAVTVTSNVNEVQDKLKLSDARVEEILGFKFNATISNEGNTITFRSDNGLGFVMNTYFKYRWGRTLASHKGIAVGDTVRVAKTYNDYLFAVGHKGVVKAILGVDFMIFVVEIDGVDSAISRQIAEVHGSKRGAYKGQATHCLACQISHVQKI